VNSPHSEQQDSVSAAAAVLVDLMPGTCISSCSSEDDEVAAINIGCQEPPKLICSQRSIIAYHDGTGSDSSANDLDLDLIEQN